MRASDFTLPTLSGRQGHLADSLGGWTVLTFWATWCGPCRSELPTLEAFHRAVSPEGVRVLAVAVTSPREQVRDLVDRLGLHFPVFLDERGAVAAQYGASSIPLSFLIDPRGRVVGVVRGARDWSEMVDLAPLLTAAVVPTGALDAAALASGPVEMPPEVEPPVVEIRTGGTRAEPGGPVRLTVVVSWSGSAGDYVVRPPRLTLPEGAALESQSARSSSEAGRKVIFYDLDVRLPETWTGDPLHLGPVEVAYVPAGATEPLVARLDGVDLEGAPPGRPGPLVVVLGLVAAAGLALTGAMLIRRRRRSAATDSAPPVDEERFRELVDRARRCRREGRFEETLAALAAAARCRGEDAEPLDAMAEALRYGGLPPDLAALDRHLARFERQRGAADNPDAA